MANFVAPRSVVIIWEDEKYKIVGFDRGGVRPTFDWSHDWTVALASASQHAATIGCELFIEYKTFHRILKES